MEEIISLSLFSLFVYVLLSKWKIIEYYNVFKYEWMPSCNFCFFFWCAIFIEIYKIALNADIALIFCNFHILIQIFLLAAKSTIASMFIKSFI